MKSNDGQVEAVLFDFGGTLIKIDNSEIPHAMKKVLKACGIDRSLEEISQAYVKSWKRVDFRDLAGLLDQFWVRWNVRVLRDLGINPNSGELAGFIRTHWSDYSRLALYSDVKEVLSQLKEKGLKVGLVTNGLQSDIDRMLSKVGLQDFFDVVVTTDILGKMKPDPEVFRYALERLKTAPSQTVFVGDEIETDYKGAQRCGLTAFLIDRESRVKDENVNKISSLIDLLKPKQEKRGS